MTVSGDTTPVPTAADAATYQPRLFQLNGRIGRARYLAYAIVPFVLVAVPGAIEVALPGTIQSAHPFAGTAFTALVLATFLLGRRRLHDLNRNGWLALMLLVPIVNLFIALWLLLAPGTAGINDHGPAPAPNTRGVNLVAWLLPVAVMVPLAAAAALFCALWGHVCSSVFGVH